MSKVNQAARLALFDSPTGYEEKHIKDKWYVKHYNGTTDKWQVAVYSEDSFERYKGFSKPQPQVADLMPWRCCVCNEITGYGPSELLSIHHCNTKSRVSVSG